MEFEIDKGVTYYGGETYVKPVVIKCGAKGIVREINTYNCVVIFPTPMGWQPFTLNKSDLVANGLSIDQTWECILPDDNENNEKGGYDDEDY